LQEEKAILETCLSEFIKGILNKFCHEFRNPLINIIQLINGLKSQIDKAFDSNIKKDILHIKYLTKSLSYLIYDFEILNYLDFKKIDLKLLLKNKHIFGESLILEEGDIELTRKTYSLTQECCSKLENLNSKNSYINEKDISNISKRSKNFNNTFIQKRLPAKEFQIDNIYSLRLADKLSGGEKFLKDEENNSQNGYEKNNNDKYKNTKKIKKTSLTNKQKLLKETILEKIYNMNENSTINIEVIKKIVVSCFKIFQTKIELTEKKIDLKYFISKDITDTLKIKCESNRFCQLLICLLSNSVKFTNQGKIALVITKNEKYFIITIKDSGIGIASNVNTNGDVPLISQPNECLTNIKLGFYIINSIIKKISGYYKIKRRKARGSTVQVFIPFFDIDKKHNYNKQENGNIKSIFEDETVSEFFNKNENFRKASSLHKINTILNESKFRLSEKEFELGPTYEIIDNNSNSNKNINKIARSSFYKNEVIEKGVKKLEKEIEDNLQFSKKMFKKNSKSLSHVVINRFLLLKNIKNTFLKNKKLSKNEKFQTKIDESKLDSLNKNNIDEQVYINESSKNYDYKDYQDSSDFINSKDSSFESEKETILDKVISFQIDYKKVPSYLEIDDYLSDDTNLNNSLILPDKPGPKYLSISNKSLKFNFLNLQNNLNNNLNNNNIANLFKINGKNNINNDCKNKDLTNKNTDDKKNKITNSNSINKNISNKFVTNDTFETINNQYSLFLNSNKLNENAMQEQKSDLFVINESFKSSRSNTNNEIIKIMVVDDEKLIRKSTMNVLNNYFSFCEKNIKIEECCDGVECLYKLYESLKNGDRFEWILIDQTMNFLNGSTTAKIIKDLIKDNILYPIDITLVTSYEISILSREFLSVFDRVFSKPITRNLLKNIFE